jgi:hypothetical protein
MAVDAAFKVFHRPGIWSKDTSRAWLFPSAGFKGRANARPFFMPKFLLGSCP